MLLVPINTDAPVYHVPVATIGLIVANLVCFAASGFALHPERMDFWTLQYGNGMNPAQWIPAAFAHGGVMHLLTNMFFLWGFGLVVEGKLGWRVFLPLYFAMAAAWGAGVDLLTLHRTDDYVLRNELHLESINELRETVRESLDPDDRPIGERLVDMVLDDGPPDDHPQPPVDGDQDLQPPDGAPARDADAEGDPDLAADRPDADPRVEELTRLVLNAAKGRCLGASGVIFALMAISLVWAPKNEMHVVGIFFYRPFSIDVSIMFFSLAFLVLNLIEFALVPGMGSSGLHLVGVAIGFPIGVLWLKRGWVDCEKWDLFSVLSGKYGRFAEPDWALGQHGNPNNYLKEIPVPETGTNGQRRSVLKNVNQLIDSGDFLTAADELMSLRMEHEDLCPNADRTKKLAMGLLNAEAWDHAEIWLQEFIDRYPDDCAWARISMAQLVLTQFRRPRAAIEYLKPMKAEELNDAQKQRARKIAGVAREQIRNGVEDEEPQW